MRQKREWLVVSGVCRAHWTVHMKATSSCVQYRDRYSAAYELSKLTPSQIGLLGGKRHRPHTASPQSIPTVPLKLQLCRLGLSLTVRIWFPPRVEYHCRDGTDRQHRRIVMKRRRQAEMPTQSRDASLGRVTSLLPEHLMDGWQAQLAQHDAVEPVWVPGAAMGPGTLVGDTVAHILSHGIETSGCIDGVETWAQRRDVGNAMQLHWDVFGTASQDHEDDDSEERLPPRLRMRLPLMSCVVYMGNVGGPTLVLDHRPHDSWGDKVRCCMCWPVAGHVFAFPGDLLHGTLVEEVAATADLVTEGPCVANRATDSSVDTAVPTAAFSEPSSAAATSAVADAHACSRVTLVCRRSP